MEVIVPPDSKRAFFSRFFPSKKTIGIVVSIFILAVIAIGVQFFGTRKEKFDTRSRAQSSASVLSQIYTPQTLDALGMISLGVDDSAIIKMPSTFKLPKPLTNSYRLADGRVFDEITDYATVFSPFVGTANAQTYIKNNANVRFISKNELSQTNAIQSVDPVLNASLDKNQTVPVIITLESPQGSYFDANATRQDRDKKKTAFDDSKKHITAVLNKGKGKIKHSLEIISAISADIDRQNLADLTNDSSVKKIELDREVNLFLDTSVLEIKANEVWPIVDSNSRTLTGLGKKIAIIDTGVDYTHPDIGGCIGANCKVYGGYDCVNNDTDPMDDHGHGTHVAAIAAGKGVTSNGQQLYGVAPDASIYAAKVLNQNGSGYESQVVCGIQRALDPNADGIIEDKVDVLSMSLGGYGTPDDAMSQAIDSVTANGVVAVIAAGNSGPYGYTIMSPGTSRTAITIGANCRHIVNDFSSYCNSGPIAYFSSRGPLIWNGQDLHKPDITAPGVNICAARMPSKWPTYPSCFDEAHVRLSGTSMATPQIAGAAILVRQAFPGYTPDQVKLALKQNAVSFSLPESDQGSGEVNVKAAVPITSLLTVNPNSLVVTSDPSIRLSQMVQQISVTPRTNDIQSLSLSHSFASASPSGISVAFSKTVLGVNNQKTDTFTVTITVNNDAAISGTYGGSIDLTENGQIKGKIPFYVTVKPTIEIVNLTQLGSEIDFGTVNPTESFWASDSKTLTFKNLRQDAPQTITLELSGVPGPVKLRVSPHATADALGSVAGDEISQDATPSAEVTIAAPIPFTPTPQPPPISTSTPISTPTRVNTPTNSPTPTPITGQDQSVIIPPSSTLLVDVGIQVTPADIPTGAYRGTLHMRSVTLQQPIIPFIFRKFYVLNVVDPSDGTASVYVVATDTDGNKFIFSENVYPNGFKLYLPHAGPYDVGIVYWWGPIDPVTNALEPRVIVKEGVSIQNGRADVTIARSQATHAYDVRGSDIQGNTLRLGSAQNIFINEATQLPFFSYTYQSFPFDFSRIYISSFSSKYRFVKHHFISTYPNYWEPSLTMYEFSDESVGLSANKSVVFTKEQLKTQKFITNTFPLYTLSHLIQPLFFTCYYRFGLCMAGYDMQVAFQQPVEQTVYYAKGSRYAPFFNLTNFDNYNQYTGTPFFYIDDSLKRSYRWDVDPPLLPNAESNIVYSGLGPQVWTGRVVGADVNRIIIYPAASQDLNPIVNGSWNMSLFARQDFSTNTYPSGTMEVYKGSTLIGSGSFPGESYLYTGHTAAFQWYYPPTNVTGSFYKIKISQQYLSAATNTPLPVYVTASYDNSKPDPNPPAIKKLYFYSNQRRSDTYDTVYASSVRVDFDPVGGTIPYASYVNASYSVDNFIYNPLNVAATNCGYEISIPSRITNSGILYIKISAEDSSTNKLEYIFGVPVGSARNANYPVAPSCAPIATPTPSCVNTTCYKDADVDGFRSNISATRCVANGNCTNSTDLYNRNRNAVIDCNDVHAGPNKCCWALGGNCSSCATNRSKGATVTVNEATGCNPTLNRCILNYHTDCKTSATCSSDGTGSCGIRSNKDSYRTVCTWSGSPSRCQGVYTGSTIDCYHNYTSCTWSW